MAKYRPHSVRTFKDLYKFFETNSKDYKKKREDHVIIVYRLGPSGNILKYTETHPVQHRQLCVHYFHGVEVLDPEATIPRITIEEIIYHLDVPTDLFVNYP